LLGKRLSHFEVTGRLGEGGMGVVYRARDTRLDREVALKILPEEFTRSEERLARFEREAKVLAALSHPNIAAIYEVGSAPASGRGRFTTWSWNWSRARIWPSDSHAAG
jgi:serine/threonine protein kinase